VARLGQQLGQGLEHEGVVEDLVARQLDAVVLAGQLAHGEQVDVQGAGAELGASLAAAVGVFQALAPGLQFAHRPVAVEGRHQVVEVAPVLEAHRLALEHPRDARSPKAAARASRQART
jgi:hypothetical protein